MDRIGIVGVSYRHASSQEVARFAIPRTELELRLPPLSAALGGAEVLYLSTCNRVEVLYALDEGPAVDLRPQVFRELLSRDPGKGEASTALRAWTGEAAMEHLFLVACGLDSAQAGEQEIYVQLRAAWEAARTAQTSGPRLDRIMSEALAMARHAHRLESHRAPSLADLAAERVLTRVLPLRPPGYVALLGVSPMTRRCGLRLGERDVPLTVVNRTFEAAEDLANALGAGAVSLESFRESPPQGCAALVCAAGAPEPLLDAGALAKLANGSRPLVIDFGLPPNIDPAAARALSLERIGMDDLVLTAREERTAHLLRLAPVRAAIDERLARLRGELAARAIGPRLARLREDFERIAAAEVERLLKGDLQDLGESQRARLTEWAQALSHRLAHLPLSGLKAAAEHATAEATEAFFREARLQRSSDGPARAPGAPAGMASTRSETS